MKARAIFSNFLTRLVPTFSVLRSQHGGQVATIDFRPLAARPVYSDEDGRVRTISALTSSSLSLAQTVTGRSPRLL